MIDLHTSTLHEELTSFQINFCLEIHVTHRVSPDEMLEIAHRYYTEHDSPHHHLLRSVKLRELLRVQQIMKEMPARYPFQSVDLAPRMHPSRKHRCSLRGRNGERHS